jgi:hypothetical protein
MAGETSLATLLRSMSPQLNVGEYVFCTLRFYYHDHLFVGQTDAERALHVLRDLAANAE